MIMRGRVISIILVLIFSSCTTEDLSQSHSDVQYINNLIHTKSDTTLPYTGLVKGFNDIGETEFSYNVKNGEMVEIVQFYDEKGSVKPPVSSNRLVERNDIVYMVNHEVPFNGCVIDTYQNGQYKYKYFLIDGLQSGLFKSWTMNGKVTGEYCSINGNINGDYSEYWDNDSLRYRGEYLDNFRLGTHKSYFENGKIDSLVEYDSLGVKDGVFQSYYENGQMGFLGEYSKGVQTGEYKTWKSDGNLWITGQYGKNGKLDGLKKMFDTDGGSSEYLYRNGVLSRVRYYDEYDLWFQSDYKDGKKQYIKHYPNSPSHPRHSVVTFEDGNDDVGWKETCFTDGTLKEKYQVDGVTGFNKVGEFYEYKQDGSLWIKGEYTDNKQTGLWVWYDEDGKVTSMSHMD